MADNSVQRLQPHAFGMVTPALASSLSSSPLSSSLALAGPGAPRSVISRGLPRGYGIPPVLRPLVRAYLLGLASTIVPRLVTLLRQQLVGRKPEAGARPRETLLASLARILRGGLDWQRFPAFCAAIVGGSTLLEVPLKAAFDRFAKNLSELSRTRLSRWLAAFVAAWASLRLLQSKQSAAFTETRAVRCDVHPGVRRETTHYAGRTLDLTFFAATRALDVVVGELWHRFQTRPRAPRAQAPRRSLKALQALAAALNSSLSYLADPSLFALSSGLIMWTWIYLPSCLPRAYTKWISSAAAVDPRLTEALRRCRRGDIVYGANTGQAPLLGAMCDDYGWPRAWGDPTQAVPFPCEMVHMGCGPSCELHALSRFARSFRWAMATYLPLNLLLVARRPGNVRFLLRRGGGPGAAEQRQRAAAVLARAVLSAARSSAFLGAFITLFYYGVCLARSRVGPRVLGTSAAARQRVDGGLCVATGCALCGWSILLEKAGRRKDMALFVAPRALATLFPRRYPREKEWLERLAFALSAAVVFTCVRENPPRVRGVLGSVLHMVLKQ